MISLGLTRYSSGGSPICVRSRRMQGALFAAKRKEARVVDRVAILGFGSSGRRFASLISQRLPESELLVYSSQRLVGVPYNTTSNLSDIQKYGPTIAVICGVASERLRMAKSLPDKVRGVLVEKPFALTYQEGLQLKDDLDRRGATVQVGYNLRFSPSLLEFKEKVESRAMGRVLTIRAETGQYLPDWRDGRDYRMTASARQKSGGGVLRELSHEIDFLRWIFGDVTWVSSWLGKQSDMEIDVEDTAFLTFGFAGDGAELSVVGQLNLDFVRRDRTRSVTAVCAEGTLRWDGAAGVVKKWASDDSRWRVESADGPSKLTTYERQWDSFYSSAMRASSPQVTMSDGLAVLSIIEAATISHDSGGIRVPPRRRGM